MGHHSCCNQQKVKRGLWSPEEDEKLIRYITSHGYGCWSEVPEKAGHSFNSILFFYTFNNISSVAETEFSLKTFMFYYIYIKMKILTLSM